MKKGSYNKGDAYEDKIFCILKRKKFLPPNTRRAGAGTGADMPFIHKGKVFILEVKKDKAADYGQKMLKWNSTDGWLWCVDDEVTQLYTELGILKILNNKNLVPIKFSKDKKSITAKDRSGDQRAFEDKIDIPVEALYKYYKGKNCFYIQIGKGLGFYHLEKDVADLGTPQFDAILKLRFRAKTIRSMPLWNYAFYAVLKIRFAGIKSKFNLEPSGSQSFPPIEK